MRKKDIVSAVHATAGLSESQADEAVSAIFEHITNALSRGESVSLVGFGTFSVKSRAARSGQHPQTRQEISIAAQRLPHFKAGAFLKSEVNMPIDSEQATLIKGSS